MTKVDFMALVITLATIHCNINLSKYNCEYSVGRGHKLTPFVVLTYIYGLIYYNICQISSYKKSKVVEITSNCYMDLELSSQSRNTSTWINKPKYYCCFDVVAAHSKFRQHNRRIQREEGAMENPLH